MRRLYLAEAIRVTKRGFTDFRAFSGTVLTEFCEDLLRKYAQQGGPALNGAVTNPGGAAEKKCYADI